MLTSGYRGRKRAYYYDSSVRGFCVAVSEKGRKLFLVYRKVQGIPERISIGTWPELAVEAARRQALRIIGQIANERIQPKKSAAPSARRPLGELFEQYLALHARPYKKPRSYAEDSNNFRRYLSGWRNRKLSSIRRRDIQ